MLCFIKIFNELQYMGRGIVVLDFPDPTLWSLCQQDLKGSGEHWSQVVLLNSGVPKALLTVCLWEAYV